MTNLIQIKGEGLNLHPNTTLNFSYSGVQIEVSLNIEPELKKYLLGNVYKGEKMYIYKLKYHLQSNQINTKSIQYVHDNLLKRCMMNIRNAKIKMLENQVKDISLSYNEI